MIPSCTLFLKKDLNTHIQLDMNWMKSIQHHNNLQNYKQLLTKHHYRNALLNIEFDWHFHWNSRMISNKEIFYQGKGFLNSRKKNWEKEKGKDRGILPVESTWTRCSYRCPFWTILALGTAFHYCRIQAYRSSWTRKSRGLRCVTIKTNIASILNTWSSTKCTYVTFRFPYAILRTVASAWATMNLATWVTIKSCRACWWLCQSTFTIRTKSTRKHIRGVGTVVSSYKVDWLTSFHKK